MYVRNPRPRVTWLAGVLALVVPIAGALSVTGCSTDEVSDTTPHEAPDGSWSTIYTPDGRVCDLWLYAERVDEDPFSEDPDVAYSYAGMDCYEPGER